MVDGVEGREYPRYLCVIRPCYLRRDTMNNDIIVPSGNTVPIKDEDVNRSLNPEHKRSGLIIFRKRNRERIVVQNFSKYISLTSMKDINESNARKFIL